MVTQPAVNSRFSVGRWWRH